MANRNKKFTIKNSIKSVVYQVLLCISKKTTNITPFQAHFERKANTPLINIVTDPRSSNLSYENILNHYLDADTLTVEDYPDENGWVTGEKNNTLIEKAMNKAQVDDKSVSRSIINPKLTNPIPRSEISLELKLATKITKRSKRDHRGLWDTFVRT